jgi:SNF2 family DNA or RNA helicase
MTLNHDIVVVGIQIFKRDFQRFLEAYRDRPTVIIADEAHALKNPATRNHTVVRTLLETRDKSLLLLTGTPINSPGDGYGMIQLVAPGVYRSRGQFDKIHVADVDFYGRPTRWQNLDLLESNLRLNAVRLLKEDVLDDLPPITYELMPYALDSAHLKLYRRLAEEHVLPLAGGGKLDATQVQTLLHALGQIVCNWAHFAQDAGKVSNGFQVVDAVVDGLGDRDKLVLFAQYRMTNRALLHHLEKYQPVAIFGDTTQSSRAALLDRFVEDPACRVFIGNPKSAGYGIDRLQHVSSTALFLEPTFSVSDFTQALSRIHRIGQTRPVTVMMASALGTLQEDMWEALMHKESLVQRLTGGYTSIRQALRLEK